MSATLYCSLSETTAILLLEEPIAPPISSGIDKSVMYAGLGAPDIRSKRPNSAFFKSVPARRVKLIPFTAWPVSRA